MHLYMDSVGRTLRDWQKLTREKIKENEHPGWMMDPQRSQGLLDAYTDIEQRLESDASGFELIFEDMKSDRTDALNIIIPSLVYYRQQQDNYSSSLDAYGKAKADVYGYIVLDYEKLKWFILDNIP